MIQHPNELIQATYLIQSPGRELAAEQLLIFISYSLSLSLASKMSLRFGKTASDQLKSSSSPLSSLSPPTFSVMSHPPSNPGFPSFSISSPDFKKDEDDNMANFNQASNVETETCLNKAVAEIVSLHHTEWISAAKTLHAKLSCSKNGMRNVEAKLVSAAEAKAAEKHRIAKILRRVPNYGPYGSETAFATFKTRRIARLFKEKVSS